MPKKIIVEILGDSRSLENAYRRSSKAGKQWGQDISHVGRGIAVAQVGFRGLGRSVAFASAGFLAGAGISSGLKAIVSDASDLNEQVNRSNVVFGKSAANIAAWSKTTADSFGIARAQALEAAGGFGSILETSGLTEKASAGMSKSLVELAADIASFNNIDPSEALEKLRSGLVGEAEPLRTVGVLLSESRVKAEAYRTGIAAVGSTLTDAQKVQARYSIILSDTARQQGDFSRTSEGLANAQRRVKASITDIAASLGSALLPGLASATSAFADFLGDLQQAKGARAKINVALDFGRDIGNQATALIGRLLGSLDEALRTTDFGALGRTVFERIRDALAGVNWREVGRAVGDGLRNALNAIAAFVAAIDWKVVGRGIIRGIVAFLKGVDWIGVFKGVVKLMAASLAALGDLLQAAGTELANALSEGLEAGLKALAKLVEVEALKVGLAILRPLDFTILGRHIIPGLNSLISTMETKLEGLATSAETSAGRVRAAIGDVGLASRTAPTAAELDAVLHPKKTAPTTTVTVPTPNVVIPTTTTTQTKSKLEKAQDAFAKVIDALNFRLQQAEATRTLKDDIRRQEAINEAIRDEIKVEGRTTDLARQLFEGRQKLADLGRQQAQQDQFRALGLTAEGDKPVASASALLRRVGTLRSQIKGTSLDTAKTAAELRRIVSVLKGRFGKAGRDVREAILGMLNDISSALGGGDSTGSAGPLTAFAKRGVGKLIEGLGLSPEQTKEIRQRFAQFGRLDLAPAGAGARLGGSGSRVPSAEEFARRKGERGDLTVYVYIDGQKVEGTVTRRQQKRAGRNAPQRRGVRPGK